MSETITIVNGATEVVTVGGGGAVQNVTVAASPAVTVTLATSQPVYLSSLVDTAVTSVVDGDLLRYQNNKWRNTSEKSITDGGNF